MSDSDGRTLRVPVRVRPGVLDGARYRPGARSLPDGAGPRPRTARLASNELAFGPLPGVLAAMDDEALARYPDAAATALRASLAAHLGTRPDRVAVGNGSVGLVEQIVRLVLGPGDELVMGRPSFGAYATLARTAGAAVVDVPLAGTALDLPAMARAVTGRTRVIFVCTPNNPTGGVVGAAAMRDFLARVPTDVLVVVDEAYREFVGEPDAADGLDLTARHANVLSLRTFSKAYGLAGMRLGYCVAHPEVVAALNAVQVPFAVNAPAQRAAIASLDRMDRLAERVGAVIAERGRVRAELHRLGLDVAASQGNFLWLPADGWSAAGVTAGLARAGVLVRPFGDAGIRVTVGSPEDDDQFLAALARLLTARPPGA